MYRVEQIVHENREINSVVLKAAATPIPRHRAGQYVWLSLHKDVSEGTPHPFSIASAPEEATLRLTIKKTGPFTQLIGLLEPGTEVKVNGPVGNFCYDIDNEPNIVLIAGGVGIVPFLSVLRHFRYAGACRPTVLIWANKTMGDTFAIDELGAMTREFDLKVVHALSRESDTTIYYGTEFPRMTYEPGHIGTNMLKTYVNFDECVKCWICGPAMMQETVVSHLVELGIGYDRIETESFTFMY